MSRNEKQEQLVSKTRKVLNKSAAETTEGQLQKWVITVALIVTLFIVGYGVLIHWSESSRRAYETSKNETSEKSRQSVTDYIHNTTESKYHVSNRINISIKDVVETQKLEVLSAIHNEYEVENKPTIWLRIPGLAVYTVDFDSVEIVADDIRNYVHVVIPEPEYSYRGIDYANLKEWIFENQGFLSQIFDGNYNKGVEIKEKQINNGEEKIKDYFTNDTGIIEKAESNAKSIISEIIYNLNPNNPDLIVKVEIK